MGILDQIQLVEREFVPGNVLIEALMIQEGVSEFHVASWFLRNIKELDCLQFLQFNRELRDFEILEESWAGDVFLTSSLIKIRPPSGLTTTRLILVDGFQMS